MGTEDFNAGLSSHLRELLGKMGIGSVARLREEGARAAYFKLVEIDPSLSPLTAWILHLKEAGLDASDTGDDARREHLAAIKADRESRAIWRFDELAPFLPESDARMMESHMAAAIEEARIAAERGEVPVGAVLAHGDEIVARARNMVEGDALTSSHAELLVLRSEWFSTMRQAAKADAKAYAKANAKANAEADGGRDELGQDGGNQIGGAGGKKPLRLYVTLEPCLMCSGAIFDAGIDELHIGALSAKTGQIRSNLALGRKRDYNRLARTTWGLMEKESSDLLVEFFQKRR